MHFSIVSFRFAGAGERAQHPAGTAVIADKIGKNKAAFEESMKRVEEKTTDWHEELAATMKDVEEDLEEYRYVDALAIEKQNAF